MLYQYYVGLDLGQSKDYTALCVLEEPVWVPQGELAEQGWAGQLNLKRSGWISPADLTPWQAEQALGFNYHRGRLPDPPLSVRHLERFPLGTPYPKVVERVSKLMHSSPLRERRDVLLVDQTGVGAAVVDSLVEAGLDPMAISIHGGDRVTREPHKHNRLRVPKRDLIGAAQVLLQSGRLRIAEGLQEAETLRKELLNFKVKIDPKTAHDSYSHWREQDHDDLVLAVSMAAWYRQWHNHHLDVAFARAQGRGLVVM
jgi:hypothetical protein